MLLLMMLYSVLCVNFGKYLSCRFFFSTYLIRGLTDVQFLSIPIGYDTGIWGTFPLKPKLPPRPKKKKKTNFWCFKHKIKLSDTVFKSKLFSEIFRDKSQPGGGGKKGDKRQMGEGDWLIFHWMGGYSPAKNPAIMLQFEQFLLRLT